MGSIFGFDISVFNSNASFRKILVAVKTAVLLCCIEEYSLLGGLGGFLWQKNSLDVGEDTTLGDGHTGEEFVQFLVVPDGQLQVSWDDSALLVVSGCVACQFQNLSG